jgi:hypothetical protein
MRLPAKFRWIEPAALAELPLSVTARKLSRMLLLGDVKALQESRARPTG